MELSQRKREKWIDVCKGFTIFLVVFGHVIDSYFGKSLFTQYNPYLKYIRFTIYSFHMPLFFMLSGYLYYKLDTVQDFRQYTRLILKKVCNLGIPYIVFSLIFGTAFILFSKNSYHAISYTDLLLIPIKPILQYWFIYVLFFIFIIVPLLDMITDNRWLILLILIIARIAVKYFGIKIYMVNMVSYYCLYFYFGSMLHLILGLGNIQRKKVLITNILLYILLNLVLYIYNVNYEILTILLAIMGSLMIINMIKLIKPNRAFYKINLCLGNFSYEIYLIHRVFSFAATLVVLKFTNNLLINLITATAVGIIVPFIVKLLSNKFAFIKFFFVPSKYILK